MGSYYVVFLHWGCHFLEFQLDSESELNAEQRFHPHAEQRFFNERVTERNGIFLMPDSDSTTLGKIVQYQIFFFFFLIRKIRKYIKKALEKGATMFSYQKNSITTNSLLTTESMMTCYYLINGKTKTKNKKQKQNLGIS